ncbi:glycosyl transferase group 1 [Methylorubrum extorquens CM4]|uniref:Glycosyl transferase group 1 n=2 Tax=Methylorubrum extorquens TaxID=408 RepID=B7L1A4_METC4|nr:glycosyl transferase group 1 [Methylorubrum extorquens CM4]
MTNELVENELYLEHTAKKLKLAIVSFPMRPGFADYMVGLCKGLSSHFELQLYISHSYEASYEQYFRASTFAFGRTRHLPLDYPRFVLAVLKNKPDICLFQAWIKLPLLDAMIIRFLRTLGYRCFVTVHDAAPHEQKWWHSVTIPIFFKSFDGGICHSNKAIDVLRKLGVRTPLTKIPHGLLDHYQKSSIDKEQISLPPIADDPRVFVILFFGHVTRRKGIIHLVAALKLIGSDHPVKLIVAGKFALSQMDLSVIERMADERAILINRLISFAEVRPLFDLSHCVVLPYLEGTTSGVLKLAMAFSKPIVSTPIGDVEEVLSSNQYIAIPEYKGSDAEFEAGIASAILAAKERHIEMKQHMEALRADYSWENAGSAYANFLASPRRKRSK